MNWNKLFPISSNNSTLHNLVVFDHSSLRYKLRVSFDPKNEKHLEDYARFLSTGSWKDGCCYVLELPFNDIPSMINSKIVESLMAPLILKNKSAN